MLWIAEFEEFAETEGYGMVWPADLADRFVAGNVRM